MFAVDDDAYYTAPIFIKVKAWRWKEVMARRTRQMPERDPHG